MSGNDTPSGDEFQLVESKRSKKKKKRNRDEFYSSVEKDRGDALVQGDVIISETRGIEEKIRRICLGDPAKRVTQKITAEIMAQVAEISKKVSRLVMRNAYLKGVIDSNGIEISSHLKRMAKVEESSNGIGRPSYVKAESTEIRSRLLGVKRNEESSFGSNCNHLFD